MNRFVLCPNCLGKGTVCSGDACLECTGSGRVTADTARMLRITRQQYTPIIHFAARSDAEERVHNGPALCQAGRAHRTEHDQRVTAIYDDANCQNCRRIVRAVNRREGGTE